MNSSCFNSLSADSNIRVIDFLLAKDHIVQLFVCLVIFDWIPNILTFMLLRIIYIFVCLFVFL